MIVRWDKENLKWIVLHYSNSLKDAERWYEKYVLKFPDCKFMMDYNQISNNQFANELQKLMEKFDLIRHLKDV
jgi:disulfide oxidoreductase YuzD